MLLKKTKYYIIWGCNYYDYQFHSGRIVWDKVNDSSDFSDCELAATNLFDHTRILRFMWNGMLQGSRGDGRIMEGDKTKNEKRIHPTQKPVQLYRMQFKNYCEPDWKVGDMHLGSGSIAIAATEFGIDLQACEIEPHYYEGSIERLKNHVAQTVLF